jgi:hypothetical protein
MNVLAANNQTTAYLAGAWGPIATQAGQIGEDIAAGVAAQGKFCAGDSYDKDYEPVLAGLPGILTIFPNLEETAENLVASTMAVAQGHRNSNDQGEELAQPLLGSSGYDEGYGPGPYDGDDGGDDPDDEGYVGD